VGACNSRLGAKWEVKQGRNKVGPKCGVGGSDGTHETTKVSRLRNKLRPAKKRRAEHSLRMIGALQRSSQEEFGSSHIVRRRPRNIVSSRLQLSATAPGRVQRGLFRGLEDPVVFLGIA